MVTNDSTGTMISMDMDANNKTNANIEEKGFSRFSGVLSVLKSARRVFSLGLLSAAVALTVTGCAKEEIKDNTSLLSEPVFDERISEEDFAFPSAPPSLTNGKSVYENNCLSCHAAGYWQQQDKQKVLAYTTPIDVYLFLTTGKKPEEMVVSEKNGRLDLLAQVHPAGPLRDKLTRDQRWEAAFYARHLAGNGDMKYDNLAGEPVDVAAVFGQNCAVCHGKRGFADGPLHTGMPKHEGAESIKVHGGIFKPPPANLKDHYARMYNRTDAQLFKYVSEGIYPSGMPAWLGNEDKQKNFKYDDKMIWMLIRHVRSLSYNNDLSPDDEIPAGVALPRPEGVHPLIPPVTPRNAGAAPKPAAPSEEVSEGGH
ncbi:MAG: c-type cytochrome [Vampirovibrio sp.]|nr:c-type cytochrome [Vampirovibrio sp.]